MYSCWRSGDAMWKLGGGGNFFSPKKKVSRLPRWADRTANPSAVQKTDRENNTRERREYTRLSMAARTKRIQARPNERIKEWKGRPRRNRRRLRQATTVARTGVEGDNEQRRPYSSGTADAEEDPMLTEGRGEEGLVMKKIHLDQWCFDGLVRV